MFYIGIILYVNGMAKDMERRLISNEKDQPIGQTKHWLIYKKEIQFHIIVIGYVNDLDLSLLIITSDIHIAQSCIIIYLQDSDSLIASQIRQFLQHSRIIRRHNGFGGVHYSIDMFDCHRIQFVYNRIKR